MKFVASSLKLYNLLNEALWENISSVTLTRGDLIFVDGTDRLRTIIENGKQRENEEYYPFHREHWIEVRKLLKIIPEQPIVLELEDHGLELSQFVVVFRNPKTQD